MIEDHQVFGQAKADAFDGLQWVVIDPLFEGDRAVDPRSALRAPELKVGRGEDWDCIRDEDGVEGAFRAWRDQAVMVIAGGLLF